jgi:hypothetical protein
LSSLPNRGSVNIAIAPNARHTAIENSALR